MALCERKTQKETMKDIHTKEKDISTKETDNTFVSNVNFDIYAKTYRETLSSCLEGFGKHDAFFDILKVDSVKRWVINDSYTYEILDFGCGIGKLTCLLAKNFQRSIIYGYDISKKSLCVARKENAAIKNVYFIDNLLAETRYDIIIAANIFHHIIPGERIKILREIKKLLKPQGKIVFFEHNPLNPFTRYIVKICPFDVGAKLIRRHELIKTIESSGFKIEVKHYILFFPWLSRVFREIERWLRHIPVGAQYFIVASNK